MSAKGYRRVSMIAAVFTAQSEWRSLTKPQQRALVTPKGAHPRVIARLQDRHLIRKDGRTPTSWGRTVLRFTSLMREGQS